MSKTFTKQELLTRSESLSKLATKYKTAQEGEVLGPEEVKDIAMETVSVLNDVQEMVEAIAEGVPAEEGSPLDSPVIDEHPVREETPGLESNLDNLRQRDEEEEEDPRKLIGKIASLQKEITGMKEASARKELATQYASLWPAGKTASAKFASFYKSKDSLPILQARLEAAKSNVGTSNSKQKQASMIPNRALYEGFNDSNNKQRIASSGNTDTARYDFGLSSMKV